MPTVAKHTRVPAYKCRYCPFRSANERDAYLHGLDHFRNEHPKLTTDQFDGRQDILNKYFKILPKFIKVRASEITESSNSTIAQTNNDVNTNTGPNFDDSSKTSETGSAPNVDTICLVDKNILNDCQLSESLNSKGKFKQLHKCNHCSFKAKSLIALISHAIGCHHRDKDIEWIITNFHTIFSPSEEPKKKKKKKVSRYIKLPKYTGKNNDDHMYQIPSYCKGESGLVYFSKSDEKFDYDIDGRVK